MDHHKRVQTSEAFINSAFLAVSGGFQDAYTYFTRDGVFSNAQTGNVVLMSERFMQRRSESRIALSHSPDRILSWSSVSGTHSGKIPLCQTPSLAPGNPSGRDHPAVSGWLHPRESERACNHPGIHFPAPFRCRPSEKVEGKCPMPAPCVSEI